MTRESVLILLGIFVTITLFIGLPLWLLKWILPFVGLVIIFIGYTLRRKRFHEDVQSSRVPLTQSVEVQEAYHDQGEPRHF